VLDASSFLDATLYKCVSAKICELDKALTAVLADLSRKHTIQTSSGETWMPTGPNLASILETTFGVRQVLASLTTQTTVSLQDISVRPLLYGMFLSLATTFDGQLIARAQPYCAVYDDGTKSCGIPPAA